MSGRTDSLPRIGLDAMKPMDLVKEKTLIAKGLFPELQLDSNGHFAATRVHMTREQLWEMVVGDNCVFERGGNKAVCNSMTKKDVIASGRSQKSWAAGHRQLKSADSKLFLLALRQMSPQALVKHLNGNGPQETDGIELPDNNIEA